MEGCKSFALPSCLCLQRSTHDVLLQPYLYAFPMEKKGCEHVQAMRLSEAPEMQGAEGSQAAICRFIGKGGKVHRDSFYKKLAAIPVSALPSSISAVDVTLESTSGEHMPSSYILDGKDCTTCPSHPIGFKRRS